MKAFLALEDGTIFEGVSIGAAGSVTGEIVFNTSMTGYQEALTDPSNYGQIVAMTYPLIGNYGINDEDNESNKVQVKGFIIRELCRQPSNWRMTGTLGDYLKDNNIIAIEGVDTRELTKIIREKGAMNGIISTDKNFNLDDIKKYKIVDAVKNVTCDKPYEYKAENGKYNVALLDLGVKRSIVQTLMKFGCNVTVFPAYTPANVITKGKFDGVMLSNGGGNPEEYIDIIENIKLLQSKNIPIFGICLGHLLTAVANGFKTKKMKYGHRGLNHPVTHIERKRTFITSQNHGYVVADVDTNIAKITHYNLNDKTIEGIKYKNSPVFTVQFHPALNTEYLFNDFIKLMEVHKNA